MSRFSPELVQSPIPGDWALLCETDLGCWLRVMTSDLWAHGLSSAHLSHAACVEVNSDTEAVAGRGFKLGCISCKMRGEVQATATVDWYFKAKGEINFTHVSMVPLCLIQTWSSAKWSGCCVCAFVFTHNVMNVCIDVFLNMPIHELFSAMGGLFALHLGWGWGGGITQHIWCIEGSATNHMETTSSIMPIIYGSTRVSELTSECLMFSMLVH